MNKKILILVSLVIIAGLGFLVFGKKDNKASSPANQNQNPSSSENNANASPDANTITGVLKVSDNKAYGNLMIVTDTKRVYLNTKRDFNALVGKKVLATINGDIKSFTLIDIVASE